MTHGPRGRPPASSHYGQCAEEIYIALSSGAGLARLEWRAPGDERRSQDFVPPAGGPALVFDRATKRWAAPAR